jgi:16S rRNA C967 or C1407 C5-methylase (RsmB/RsmF family)/NOL1/NOP2/fmu family ribosome biogenesis protein
MANPLLPPEFVDQIGYQLGPDHDRFLDSYDQPPAHGLRINPAKGSLTDLRTLTGWPLEPIPWCPTGAYINPDLRAGSHPLHATGRYYLQEPSAMMVAELADLQPGLSVLDLAASPGGKSTQIASAIGPTGLLVANEIHPSRIKALGENLERWGVTNTIITNRTPESLAQLGQVFDRVIVDAPCSGEGLFRREPESRLEWSPERVLGCAVRQSGILESAVQLVQPGGLFIYSTCTFNRAENEDVIAELTQRHPDFSVEEAIRLWPHEVRSEGHTIHRLRRSGDHPGSTMFRVAPESPPSSWTKFVAENLVADPFPFPSHRVAMQGDRVSLVPAHPLAQIIGKHVRAGLWLGDVKPGRFEPSHALALAIDPNLVRNRLDVSTEEAQLWISGAPLTAAGDSGWALITYAGNGLGWGKRTGNTVKNHYPKGLRRPLK